MKIKTAQDLNEKQGIIVTEKAIALIVSVVMTAICANIIYLPSREQVAQMKEAAFIVAISLLGTIASIALRSPLVLKRKQIRNHERN